MKINLTFVLTINIILFIGCTKDSKTPTETNSNLLIGTWKSEIHNQDDGDTRYVLQTTIAKFESNKFDISYEADYYSISNPSITGHYSDLKKYDYISFSDRLINTTVTYREINGEIRYDELGEIGKALYEISDDVLELAREVKEKTQIAGTQGILENSSFYAQYSDTTNYEHTKWFYTSDSLYRYWVSTQSNSQPTDWGVPTTNKIEIVSSDTYKFYWKDTFSIQKYIFRENILYIGDESKNFHKQ